VGKGGKRVKVLLVIRLDDVMDEHPKVVLFRRNPLRAVS